MLRAFQTVRGTAPDPGFMADLEYAQHKDLDLSVRIGALLAFDALLVTAAINPLAASPGAPLSLDAATQPWEVVAVGIGIVLLAASSYLCVRSILIGEEFSSEGLEGDPIGLGQRLLAAYIASVDAQTRLIGRAVQLTIAGGLVSAAACIWILADKMSA